MPLEDKNARMARKGDRPYAELGEMRGQERLEHERQPRNSTIRIFQLFQWVPVQNCLACVGGGACCKESAITTSLHLSSFVRGWGTPSKCRH